MTITPPTPSHEQRSASDPSASVWVSANAGSGKTFVLAERVIRLMLDGTEPDRILCLTYTKAAAAEMASRVFGRLGKWVSLGDDALTAELDALDMPKATAETRKRARQLFTLALETPGGLKIQTIHAFCERLLQLFPVEAGIVPGFEVMDERGAAELLQEARRQVIAEADARGDPVMIGIAARVHASTFDKLIGSVLAKRSDLAPILSDPSLLADALAALRVTLAIGQEETDESIESQILAIDRHRYQSAADVLRQINNKTDPLSAQKIRQLLAHTTVSGLQDFHLTAASPPKARALSTLITKKSQTAFPAAADFLCQESGRICTLFGRLADLEKISATDDLLTLASRIVHTYEKMKRRHGRYDFADLIARTKHLLAEQATSAWVLYKLDGGIDHILIDEAQDTSPDQWSIVRTLTEEFFAGSGARGETDRTLFVVGDRKQSIFSFQGADPKEFDATHDHYAASIATGKFHSVKLESSYRSVETILSAVDNVFSDPIAQIGLISDAEPHVLHQSNRPGQAGLVEIWPPELKDEKEEPDPWQAPVDRVSRNHPSQKLAHKIAAAIRDWLDKRRFITALGRPVRPSDILILVRRRDQFFDAMIRALRQKNVPVAGADRIILNAHLAVQDLLALGQFVTLPEDDLSLASVLKSPLVSHPEGRPFNDGDLFHLAHDRGRASLWDRLAAADTLSAIHRQLVQWMDFARSLSPFDFFSAVLTSGSPNIRQRMLSRLGSEAGDLIDAFLNLALDFERQETPSLSGFLTWFTAAETEIKRDMEQDGGEVRIMTVHGAKGLEASVVFLPDTCALPHVTDDLMFFVFEDAQGRKLPLWRLSNGIRSPQLVSLQNEVKRRHNEEYRRQLYVAMTRAADELYICGHTSDKKPSEESWYAMMQRSVTAAPDGDGIIRLRGTQSETPFDRRQQDADAAEAPALPPWAGEAAASTRPPPPWRPSARDVRSDAAAARGTAIHKLFQILPELAPGRRLASARRLLARRGFSEPEIKEITGSILAIIEHPDFAPFFVPCSLGEAGIAARQMSGRVDRIVLETGRVLILDYKTDRDPPATPAEVSPAYIKQLAAYRSTLQTVFPGLQVAAALLWTEIPRLMPIPDALLDAAFA
ncbi:double-strand break repair helicase AddA [soil metagenome]